MVEDYLSRKGIYAKGSTVGVYRLWLTRFCEHAGDTQKISFDKVVSFSQEIKKNYSESSVSLGLGIVKSYLKFLERYGNNCESQDLRIPRAHANAYEPITPEEYVSMLSFIKTDTDRDIRDNTIVRLLYDTGARIGEICALEFREIDLKERTAWIWTEKTVQKRMIMWGYDTNEFLKTFLSLRGNSPGFIFPCCRTVERIVKKYKDLAGIKKEIVPHSFRHGKAHLILDSGGGVKDIQETLGHRSPESSFRYLNLNKAEKIKMLKKYLTNDRVGNKVTV